MSQPTFLDEEERPVGKGAMADVKRDKFMKQLAQLPDEDPEMYKERPVKDTANISCLNMDGVQEKALGRRRQGMYHHRGDPHLRNPHFCKYHHVQHHPSSATDFLCATEEHLEQQIDKKKKLKFQLLCFSRSPYIMLVFAVPQYDAVSVPFAQHISGFDSGISPLQRIAIGLFTTTSRLIHPPLVNTDLILTS
ncbi:hypothetical protein EJ110_NYTH56741 [Nymphaea thermarum]|nr:hypothetical protein EJ110_NYTH56741 [Nymphaea thermarum]